MENPLLLLRIEHLLIGLGIPLVLVILSIVLRYNIGETYTSGADLLLAGAVLDLGTVAAYDNLLPILSYPFREIGQPLFVILAIAKVCFLPKCLKVERKLTLNFMRKVLNQSGKLPMAPTEIKEARFPLLGLLWTWLLATTLIGFDVFIFIF